MALALGENPCGLAVVADVKIKRPWQVTPVKDHTRLTIDNYYFTVDKADSAGGGRDFRQVPMDTMDLLVNQFMSPLEARVAELERVQKILVNGVYAHGVTSGLVWSPGVATPTDATRIPITTVSMISNIDQPNQYTFTPIVGADYFLDIRLSLDLLATPTNHVWNLNSYIDGIAAGAAYSFNTKDVSALLHITGRLGFHVDPGQQIDIRLWSDNATSTVTVQTYQYSIFFAGLDI